ncbi:hypothetical protein LWF15_08630 [Kineosporia rhizophila]|uniref:hypothetical protein n=1 Tax=Kineosporia TaxID=49184 RepID=UPI001E649ACD|nr:MULTISPECIES: hypothetical protein [Kineosporia]MCE0535574.1 hypothetical protein [Kineosporia rhizophila]GLY17783.1 hypothetical protein Kisp01_47970 [Kineosporia sp. NBRC 101677]
MGGTGGETVWLGVVLGGAVVAFALCLSGIRRLRRALAQDAINALLRPYRLEDLDQTAGLAAGQITMRHVRRGTWGFAVTVLDLLAWIAAVTALISGVRWLQDQSSDSYAFSALGWLPYAPAAAVLTAFALLLYLLAHEPERRTRLRSVRWLRRLLPLSATGYLDPDCSAEFGILAQALLTRSRATQQAARDQVAELAHALLPQARQMADDDLRRTVESAVAFVPRQNGPGLDTDRFAELLTLFDALFGRLRDDTGHQDVWRIAILRQLIRYTGPNVLPEIFGQLQTRPDAVGIDGLSVTRTSEPSLLHTAFGREAGADDGLDLLVDLTRQMRQNAGDRDDDPR